MHDNIGRSKVLLNFAEMTRRLGELVEVSCPEKYRLQLIERTILYQLGLDGMTYIKGPKKAVVVAAFNRLGVPSDKVEFSEILVKNHSRPQDSPRTRTPAPTTLTPETKLLSDVHRFLFMMLYRTRAKPEIEINLGKSWLQCRLKGKSGKTFSEKEVENIALNCFRVLQKYWPQTRHLTGPEKDLAELGSNLRHDLYLQNQTFQVLVERLKSLSMGTPDLINLDQLLEEKKK